MNHREIVTAPHGPYSDAALNERSDNTEPSDLRALIPLSRRRTLTSLLGISGLISLSDRASASAVNGDSQRQIGTEQALNLPFTHTVTFLNPNPDPDDRFGMSIALSADGNTALVGAVGDNTESQTGVGEAYVFNRTETGWETTNPVILPNPEPEPDFRSDRFGWDVALSAEGNTALISAPYNGGDVPNDDRDLTGEAYLFEQEKQPLVFTDQVSASNMVTISSVTMPNGGFVVIASADGNTIYGTSEYLSPGITTDLQITLETPLPRSGTYLASGQADTNGNQHFDASQMLEVCQLDADESPLLDTAEITIQ